VLGVYDAPPLPPVAVILANEDDPPDDPVPLVTPVPPIPIVIG
jgi:hypothetical protein